MDENKIKILKNQRKELEKQYFDIYQNKTCNNNELQNIAKKVVEIDFKISTIYKIQK